MQISQTLPAPLFASLDVCHAFACTPVHTYGSLFIPFWEKVSLNSRLFWLEWVSLEPQLSLCLYHPRTVIMSAPMFCVRTRAPPQLAMCAHAGALEPRRPVNTWNWVTVVVSYPPNMKKKVGPLEEQRASTTELSVSPAPWDYSTVALLK